MRISNHYGWVKFIYLIRYLTKKSGIQDRLSEKLLLFKNNDPSAVGFFTDIACDVLEKELFSIDLVVRALGHEEKKATGDRALDTLGKTLADRLGAEYNPQALYKVRDIPQLKGKPNDEKQELLDGLYAVRSELIPNMRSGNVLLVDDLLTSGKTANEIRRALKEKTEIKRTFLFSIGKTAWQEEASGVNNSELLNQYLEELGLPHVQDY